MFKKHLFSPSQNENSRKTNFPFRCIKNQKKSEPVFHLPSKTLWKYWLQNTNFKLLCKNEICIDFSLFSRIKTKKNNILCHLLLIWIFFVGLFLCISSFLIIAVMIVVVQIFSSYFLLLCSISSSLCSTHFYILLLNYAYMVHVSSRKRAYITLLWSMNRHHYYHYQAELTNNQKTTEKKCSSIYISEYRWMWVCWSQLKHSLNTFQSFSFCLPVKQDNGNNGNNSTTYLSIIVYMFYYKLWNMIHMYNKFFVL